MRRYFWHGLVWKRKAENQEMLDPLRLTTYLPTAIRRIPKLNSPIPNSFIFNFQFSTLDS